MILSTWREDVQPALDYRSLCSHGHVDAKPDCAHHRRGGCLQLSGESYDKQKDADSLYTRGVMRFCDFSIGPQLVGEKSNTTNPACRLCQVDSTFWPKLSAFVLDAFATFFFRAFFAFFDFLFCIL